MGRRRAKVKSKDVSQEGQVFIERKDGAVFVLTPQIQVRSPLDVEGISLDITTEEIVACVQESRQRFDIQPSIHNCEVSDD